MSGLRGIDRDTVVALLASYHDRSPQAVGETLGSLELAWLIHMIEERYDTRLPLDAAALDRMSTVADAVTVLNDVLTAAGHG
jgi:hypothetical protein